MRPPGTASSRRHEPAVVDHRYKTNLCRDFEQAGACPKGDQCVFAHGQAELRLKGGAPPALPPPVVVPNLLPAPVSAELVSAPLSTEQLAASAMADPARSQTTRTLSLTLTLKP